MDEKILLVDDETAVLQGYQRLLRNDFVLETAIGGAAGLSALAQKGPYAVVVSDMRMPEMDGIQFLSKVKATSPETIRVMLTGNADLETAVNAVNEGNIFRFLTKPCTKETLGKTLTAALLQYRLVTAEKDLLERTLKGSVHVLTEVLSLVNPAAFSRAARLRSSMAHIAKAMGIASPWRLEVAAMMSQLGCVTLHPETIEAVYTGQELPPEEQARYDAHPQVARDLLASIPRLEPIAWMIAHQNQPLPGDDLTADRETADLRLGAELLRATLNFDDLLRKGYSRTEAAHRLSREHKDLDARIFSALVELDPEVSGRTTRSCSIEELSTGMVLNQEVRTKEGVLVVAKGQEVTFAVIAKLKNFSKKGAIPETTSVIMPKETISAGVKAVAAGAVRN